MIKVEMSEQEWSQIISIIASSHPLVMKISQQVVAHKQEERHAAKGNGLGSHPRADAPRFPSTEPPPNSGHSPQQRETGPIQASPTWPPKPE